MYKAAGLIKIGGLIYLYRYYQQIRVIYYRYINIRRRGDVGGSAKKMGLRIRELERLYGIRQGGSGYYGNQYEESSNNFKTPKTQDQLATSMGMTVQTLHNYKLLSDMIPELVELLRINLMALYLDTEKRTILYVVEQ